MAGHADRFESDDRVVEDRVDGLFAFIVDDQIVERLFDWGFVIQDLIGADAVIDDLDAGIELFLGKLPFFEEAIHRFFLLLFVKGIGLKTAQRLILELKDKIVKGDAAVQTEIFNTVDNQAVEEATQALVMLGFGKPAVAKAVQKILEKKPDSKVEEIIKAALQML